MTRLGKNGEAKPDRFRKAWNPGSIRIRSARSGRRSSSAIKKLSRGASLRGQGTPADPARLRSVRARNPGNLFAAGWRKIQGRNPAGFRLTGYARRAGGVADFARSKNLFVFVAAEKLVPLDRGNYADGAFVAWLG